MAWNVPKVNFSQLHGWMGVEDLWFGATSDTYYQEKTQKFSQQQKFTEKDHVSEKKHIPILDKCYGCVLSAQRAGGQECIQTIFAKNDLCFVGDDTLVIDLVTFDHSGNERCVHLSKKPSFIKKRFDLQHMS